MKDLRNSILIVNGHQMNWLWIPKMVGECAGNYMYGKVTSEGPPFDRVRKFLGFQGSKKVVYCKLWEFYTDECKKIDKDPALPTCKALYERLRKPELKLVK